MIIWCVCVYSVYIALDTMYTWSPRVCVCVYSVYIVDVDDCCVCVCVV